MVKNLLNLVDQIPDPVRKEALAHHPACNCGVCLDFWDLIGQISNEQPLSEEEEKWLREEHQSSINRAMHGKD